MADIDEEQRKLEERRRRLRERRKQREAADSDTESSSLASSTSSRRDRTARTAPAREETASKEAAVSKEKEGQETSVAAVDESSAEPTPLGKASKVDSTTALLARVRSEQEAAKQSEAERAAKEKEEAEKRRIREEREAKQRTIDMQAEEERRKLEQRREELRRRREERRRQAEEAERSSQPKQTRTSNGSTPGRSHQAAEKTSDSTNAGEHVAEPTPNQASDNVSEIETQPQKPSSEDGEEQEDEEGQSQASSARSSGFERRVTFAEDLFTEQVYTAPSSEASTPRREARSTDGSPVRVPEKAEKAAPSPLSTSSSRPLQEELGQPSEAHEARHTSSSQGKHATEQKSSAKSRPTKRAGADDEDDDELFAALEAELDQAKQQGDDIDLADLLSDDDAQQVPDVVRQEDRPSAVNNDLPFEGVALRKVQTNAHRKAARDEGPKRPAAHSVSLKSVETRVGRPKDVTPTEDDRAAWMKEREEKKRQREEERRARRKEREEASEGDVARRRASAREHRRHAQMLRIARQQEKIGERRVAMEKGHDMLEERLMPSKIDAMSGAATAHGMRVQAESERAKQAKTQHRKKEKAHVDRELDELFAGVNEDDLDLASLGLDDSSVSAASPKSGRRARQAGSAEPTRRNVRVTKSEHARDAGHELKESSPSAAASVDLDVDAAESRERLASDAARHKMQLAQQRKARPRMHRKRYAQLQKEGHGTDLFQAPSTDTRQRAHTVSAATLRPTRSKTAGGASSASSEHENQDETQRPRHIRGLPTSKQERDYRGYSLAYMLNQEMMHSAKDLKSTGAKLTASGSAKLKRVHGSRDRKLFRITGRRKYTVSQVEVSTASLVRNAAFVLDDVNTIYTWAGPDSNTMERAHAKSLAIDMKDVDSGGKASIISTGKSPGDDAEFMSILGDSSTDVEITATYTPAEDRMWQAFRVEDRDGEANLVLEAEGCPFDDTAFLKEDGVYLIACDQEVFVWLGSRCDRKLRDIAEREGQKIIAEATSSPGSENSTTWFGPKVIRQRGEPASFRHKFRLWQEGPSLAPRSNTISFVGRRHKDVSA